MSTASGPSGRDVTAARWAVAAIFAVHGAVTGSFSARIPWIVDHLQLSEAHLGIALIMPAIGSMACMPLTGHLVQRLGSRRATRLLIAAWTIMLAFIPLAPNRWVLMAVLLVAGACAGMADVAMNAEGVAVERLLGRPVMSGLHGAWSFGGLVGGAVAAAAAFARIPAPEHLAVVAVVLLVVGVAAGRRLLPSVPVPATAAGPRFSLPTGPVLLIALVGFCAVFAEVAATDWSSYYLKSVLHSSDGTGAVAYACFALAMAASRLAGDAVVRRHGAVRTVRVAATLGVTGGVAVVAAPAAVVAIAGFVLIGVGVAVVVPLAFSAAGHAGGNPAHAIAGVATVAYGAGLGAPGLIGLLADATSLEVSFTVVTGLILIVALGAGRLRAADPAPSRDLEADVVATGEPVSAVDH